MLPASTYTVSLLLTASIKGCTCYNQWTYSDSHHHSHYIMWVQGSPTSSLWVGTSCQISGSIRLEIKCPINVTTWISSKPSPAPDPANPGLGKNCLPWNQSLVPKRLGTSDTVYCLAKNSVSFDRYIITWELISKELYFFRLQNHCRWWLQSWN